VSVYRFSPDKINYFSLILDLTAYLTVKNNWFHNCMRKTDKKIDNAIISALTEVCEVALKEVAGFKWITHFVNYRDVANSLIVVCVFGSNSELSNALKAGQDHVLRQLIQQQLTAVNIKLRKPVNFDSEQACDEQNNGDWQQRYG